MKTLTLKQRFEERCINITKYARKIGVERSLVSKVINGNLDGSKGGKDVRRIFAHLKEDGIWIGKLPWEDKNKKAS